MKPSPGILADLHIHTALSPCGDEEMTPPAIVAAAIEKGLAMIAICDHNSAGNAHATQQAAGSLTKSLAVLAGMELTTAEEVHVLGLFPTAEAACACAAEVLPTLPARWPQMGEQRLMDAAGRTVGTERAMLSAASEFSLEEGIDLIHRHGGLAVASHVDRPAFSVMSQLGLFPREAGFDAIEVYGAQGAAGAWTGCGLPVIQSSDSHYLADIGSRRSCLPLSEPTFDALRRLLTRKNGGYFGSA